MKRSKFPRETRPSVATEDLLQDLLITQLGIAGVPQLTIRGIVGCDIHRVSRIVKHLKRIEKSERG
jgi:hypothetical protein